jgi:hypothetical protein
LRLRAARKSISRSCTGGSSDGRRNRRPMVQRSRTGGLSLGQHPKRCPVAPESFDSEYPVRVLTYGRKPHACRILFMVDDEAEVVRVLHVRRGARQPAMADESKAD